MRTIELTRRSDVNTEEQLPEKEQQPVILTFGRRPVATLLPMADKIARLSKFEQVIESEESVTLTINGRPIAIIQTLAPLVVIDDEEVDLEGVALSTHPQFLALIERSRERRQAEGGISGDEMRRRLGL